MLALTESDIPAYLYFGYLPELTTELPDLLSQWGATEANLHTSRESPWEVLVEDGAKLLKRVLKTAIAGTAKSHVLPLSGGMDSRAILGGLLENVDPKQIQTVTFGSSGTWDFDIGQGVAKAAGVPCEPLDLTSESWKWDATSLAETAAHTERPVWVFDANVNRSIARRFGTDYVYWSGFMGGLTGSPLLTAGSASWEEAKKRFSVTRRFAKSLQLAPAHFKPENCLPPAPYTDPRLVCYDEQIDIGVEDLCKDRYTILPMGYEYRTPLLDPEWVGFMLSVPRRHREGRRLYRGILERAYPKLYALPTKNNYGFAVGTPRYAVWARRAVLKALRVGRRSFPMWPWGVEPRTNYIDFDAGLREREDLKRLVQENLEDLKKRRIVSWLDMDAVWLRHQRGQANHGDALTLLASLEIYLKASQR